MPVAYTRLHDGTGSIAVRSSFTTAPGRHLMAFPSGLFLGEATDAINIKSLRLEPDPPKPGQNLTIYATGTANTLIAVRCGPISFIAWWRRSRSVH